MIKAEIVSISPRKKKNSEGIWTIYPAKDLKIYFLQYRNLKINEAL